MSHQADHVNPTEAARTGLALLLAGLRPGDPQTGEEKP